MAMRASTSSFGRAEPGAPRATVLGVFLFFGTRCVENASRDSDTPRPVSRPSFPVSATADRRPLRTRTGRMDSDDDISRASRAKRGSPYLNTDQAAAYLKFSSRLLKRLRRAGKENGRAHV